MASELINLYDLEGREIAASLSESGAASILKVDLSDVVFSLSFPAFVMPIPSKGYAVKQSELDQVFQLSTVRGSVEKALARGVKMRSQAVVLYDKEGVFYRHFDSAREAAQDIGANAPHVSRARKAENSHHTIAGYYARSLADVVHPQKGLIQLLDLSEVKGKGRRTIFVYNYSGKRIGSCSGVEGVTEKYDLNTSIVTRALARGRALYVGEDLLFFNRNCVEQLPLIEGEAGEVVKNWQLTSDGSDEVIISTRDVGEIAEYLNVGETLIYDAVKNYRKVSLHFRVHSTEAPEMFIDLKKLNK